MAAPTEPRAAATRRTENVRTRGRAARVVCDVLRCAAEELGRVGYAGLRIEDVAASAGVNKTTIYRRWPTKAELVGDALRAITEQPEVPDTGSLRADLLQHLRQSSAFASRPLGQGLIRVLQAERADPELEALTRALRADSRRRRAAMVQRSIDRGELPPGTNAELIAEMVFIPVFHRIGTLGEPLPEGFLEAVVDLVLAGARAGGASSPGAKR